MGVRLQVSATAFVAFRHGENANAGAPNAGVRCPRDPDVEGVPGRALEDSVFGRPQGLPLRPAGRPIGRALIIDEAWPTPAMTGPLVTG